MKFKPYLERWGLTPDGAALVTHTSHLLPVCLADMPAMLKISSALEERLGGTLLEWWDGDGAVRVLARDGDALLLERATGDRSLAAMARSGHDDEASQIICSVAARLHQPRGEAPSDLIPLVHWFRELEPAADMYGGILANSAATARMLLADPQDTTVLHGDIHHGNILDAGPRGWLAIDPKRLRGERGFDFANIFCNPDSEVATAPGRLARQADVVSQAAGLDRTRLMQWVLAYAGLSAAWWLGDNETTEAELPLTVARLAAIELGER
jgi:streptomycin 6-kinase